MCNSSGDCASTLRLMTDNLLTSDRIERCTFSGSVCNDYCMNPDLFVVNSTRKGVPGYYIEPGDLSDKELLQDFCDCSRISGLDCNAPENLQNCTVFYEAR